LKLNRVQLHNRDTTNTSVITVYFLHLTHRYLIFGLMKWNEF